MSIRDLFGLGGKPAPAADTAETHTVRKVVEALDQLPPDRARFIAAFGYILGRVAHADSHISPEETAAMERIISRYLPPEQAVGGAVTVWANALGPVTPLPETGNIPQPPGSVLRTDKIVRVFVSGVEAEILDAVLQPFSVDVFHSNARIPLEVGVRLL